MQRAQPIRKTKIGRVVSDKMQKTVVVRVETVKRHPLYKKAIRTSKKFKAHDEHGIARMGDLVKIVETRPLSKEKRWRVVEVIERGERLVETAETPESLA